MNDPGGFARWPLLAASVTLAATGLALDLSNAGTAPYAIACLILAACAFGAFLYAEGARHREWWQRQRTPRHAADDAPAGQDQGDPG